jgi:pantoate--beta-alanine ligase
MKVSTTVADMKRARCLLAEPVGFVPTMGFLHEGHLSLVRRAKAENAEVVVSIYVNPTQFGPAEDFHRYPRDIPHDLSLLEKENVDAVFMPESTDMYPAGYDTWVTVDDIARRLEGDVRPGHFKGVATVCSKLFNIVRPTNAYFGQKDAQQVLVIKKMVADLNMNLEIVVVPTIREPDGLAMSSRNIYLAPREREAATILFRALKLVKSLWQHGENDARVLKKKMTELIQQEPLASIDYISIANNGTLRELEVIEAPALVSLAVRIGQTRLIDNSVLA